jgi:hypothetical protein
MPVTMRGVEAKLVWGYLPAGTLGAYTVTRELGRWTLTATVVSSDAFRVAQHPLAFVAPHAKGAWRWPVDALSIVDGTLSALLGPPEH